MLVKYSSAKSHVYVPESRTIISRKGGIVVDADLLDELLRRMKA